VFQSEATITACAGLGAASVVAACAGLGAASVVTACAGLGAIAAACAGLGAAIGSGASEQPAPRGTPRALRIVGKTPSMAALRARPRAFGTASPGDDNKKLGCRSGRRSPAARAPAHPLPSAGIGRALPPLPSGYRAGRLSGRWLHVLSMTPISAARGPQLFGIGGVLVRKHLFSSE
jgi:hypothetical protein